MEKIIKRENMETIVRKATSSKKVEPPKRKHVRSIIVETWNHAGANDFLYELFRRQLETNEIVCWKALITVHTVLLEGHPKVLEDTYFKITFFEGLRESYSRPQIDREVRGFAPLIQIYLNLILEKILFHRRHPQFTGDFSLDKYLTKREKLSSEKSLEIVSHLLDLLICAQKMYDAIFHGKDLGDAKTSCLLPVVLDSYGAYTILVYLLRKMVDEVDNVDVLTFSIERFYSQYIVLRSFYSDVASLKSISSIIAVPTLPKDPPSFQTKRQFKPKPSTQIKPAPVSSPTHPPKELPKSQPIPQFQHVQVQPVQPPIQPIQSHSTNPFLSFNPVTPVTQTPSFNPFAEPPKEVSKPPPIPQEPKKTGALDASLGDLLQMVSAMKSPPTKRKKDTEDLERKKREEEERIRKEAERRKLVEAQQKKEAEEKRKKEEEERKLAEQRLKAEEEKRKKEEEEKEQKRKKEEEERKKREEEERQKREEESRKKMEEQIKNVVQQEASKEISALKVNIIELQTALENRTKENEIQSKNMNDRIKDLENLLAQEREANKKLRQELEVTKQKLDESQKSKQELQELINSQQSSLNQLTVSQSQLANENQLLKNNIEALIQAQQDENQKQIDREVEAAREELEFFIRKLDSPTYLGDPTATIQSVVESSNNLSGSLDQLLKSRSETKEEFIDQLRATLHVTNRLFDVTKGVSRNVEDTSARQQLLDSARNAANAVANLISLLSDEVDKANEALQASKHNLAELANSAENTSKTTIDVGSLESLAERELLTAAQQIEDAAKMLREAKAKPRKPDNIADAILMAALAITDAVAQLVKAATVAQQERSAKGLAEPSNPFHQDPAWAQGLVSAAKSVAASTQLLVRTANDAVEGKVDEERVIAASKGVAASTAQLVAACRAKSDPNAPSQLKLEAAAKRITEATQALVEAARAARQLEGEENVMEGPMTDVEFKKKVMEMQAEILKFEREKENAQSKLARLRKQRYG